MNDIIVQSQHQPAVAHEQDRVPSVSVASDSSLNSRLLLQYDIAARRPRSPTRVRGNLIEMVTLDPDSAQESMYALPRAGKPVTGPSIRFAEALKQAWGNCWASSEVRRVNREEKYVESIGFFIDFETNAVTEFTHQRSIAGRNGKIFSEDMIRVTANAASSIAMREAILKGIPKPIWRAAYEAVVKVIAGDIMTLSENRVKAIQAFAIYGVKAEQIFAAIGVVGDADITLEHITVMRGMFSALRNGEETVETMFFRQGEKAATDPDTNPLVREKTDTVTGEVTTVSTATNSNTEAQREAQGNEPASASSEQSQASAQGPDISGSGTSEADASSSSQPDLLSAGSPSAGGKGEANSPGQTEGAGVDQSSVPSAPDRLRSYSKALLSINDGGPPKLVKQSNAWVGKHGGFVGAEESKRNAIYNAHVDRLTSGIDIEATKAKVEGIIGA